MSEYNTPNYNYPPQGVPPVPPPPKYVYITYDQGTPPPVNEEPTEPPEKKGFAITSMVLGIVALALCCIPILSGPCGIVGLIMGLVSIVKKKDGLKMAKAGVACSYVALGITIIGIIIGLLMKIPFIKESVDNFLWYLRQ